MKVVVIGTNHAGTYAVNTLIDTYKDSVEVTTYDANNNISFLGCGMALWIGNVIDSPDGLFYESADNLRSKGVDVFLEHEVSRVDFNAKKIYINDINGGVEKEDSYDKLIIATGSWPIKPGLEGIDLENIIYAKRFQHAQRAKEILKDDSIKNVVVVGGGYIGIELVEAFKNGGKEATLITNEEILNRYYDANFTVPMRKRLEENGVKVVENESVAKFTGENGKVKSVVTNKGEYDADIVLMSVGVFANTKFLEGTDLERNERGVIVVNDKQETNIKDVYSIGDCSTIRSNILGKGQNIGLATNAVRTGIVAAHNAAGTELSLNGVQGSNAIHIYGLTMASTGINEMGAKMNGYDYDTVEVTDTLRPDFMPDNENVTLKILWDKKTLKIIGVQMMSNEDITLALHMFSLAIEQGYTMDKLATLDLFFLPHFNKPENFITKAGILALQKIVKY